MRRAMALAALAWAVCARAARAQDLTFKVGEAEVEACETCLNGEQQCKWCMMWKDPGGGLDIGGACQCRQGDFGDCHFALAFSDEVTDKAACRTFLPETQSEPTCSTCPEGCGLCRSAQGREFCDCTGKCDCDYLASGKCDASTFAYFNLQPACDGITIGDGGDIPIFVFPLVGAGACMLMTLFCAYMRAANSGTGPPPGIPVWDVTPAWQPQTPAAETPAWQPQPQTPAAETPAAVPMATVVSADDTLDSKDGFST